MFIAPLRQAGVHAVQRVFPELMQKVICGGIIGMKTESAADTELGGQIHDAAGKGIFPPGLQTFLDGRAVIRKRPVAEGSGRLAGIKEVLMGDFRPFPVPRKETAQPADDVI